MLMNCLVVTFKNIRGYFIGMWSFVCFPVDIGEVNAHFIRNLQISCERRENSSWAPHLDLVLCVLSGVSGFQ